MIVGAGSSYSELLLLIFGFMLNLLGLGIYFFTKNQTSDN